MSRVKFILPAAEHESYILDYIKEHDNFREPCLGFADFSNYGEWLEQQVRRREKLNLQPNEFPSTLYLVFNEFSQLIGISNFKTDLPEELLQHIGHIGYAIRPHQRNKGYATELLRECLPLAKSMGLNIVLITCNESNIASAKVIEKNNGVFENNLYVENEQITVKRYWISLENEEKELS